MKKLLLGFGIATALILCIGAAITNTNTILSWTASSLNSTQFNVTNRPITLTNISGVFALSAGTNINITGSGTTTKVHVSGGITTNLNVLIAGVTTNQLQFTNGILKAVVPQ